METTKEYTDEHISVEYWKKHTHTGIIRDNVYNCDYTVICNNINNILQFIFNCMTEFNDNIVNEEITIYHGRQMGFDIHFNEKYVSFSGDSNPHNSEKIMRECVKNWFKYQKGIEYRKRVK